MSKKDMKSNDNRKNSSEKDTNINSDMKKKYFQDSPNSDDIEKDKPIHFKIEYDQNKNFENQIESSPNSNNSKNKSKSNNISNKKGQEFIIEKNNQVNNKNNNPDYFQENDNNNIDNNENNQYYNLLKDNVNNDNDNDKNDNFNNYYYYYLNNYNNNKNTKNNEDEEDEPKKVISFATQTYQGRIDPVKLNKKYNNFWQSHNKSKQKYKQKIDSLKKVFHPYGYNEYHGYKTIINNNKKRRMSQSRYSTGITINNIDRPSFDNTKKPLPKKSYLLVPYDYGINDPNYGKEDPANYDRKKMAKLRMLKQPLKYYYPYTNDNVKNKKGFKYE